MNTNGEMVRLLFPVALGVGALLFLAVSALGHCDTLDGPVIAAAKSALEKGEVAPVLKWVRKEAEPEVRAAFKQALTVRSKGPEARELADRYFFETLVRVHRAGEGAPFEGLKPAGAELEPAVAAADQSLETGKVDALVKLITDATAKGIRERFAKAVETRKHAEESVEAGREFVEAYVQFVHYAEGLDLAAKGPAGHHGAAAKEPGHQEPAAGAAHGHGH